MKTKKLISILTLLVIPIIAIAGLAFIHPGSFSTYDPPGFFYGVWHGLIAPYTLIIRIFTDVYMYAVPNSGWTYDLGFLIGIIFCIPIGWIAAIISLLCLLLS